MDKKPKRKIDKKIRSKAHKFNYDRSENDDTKWKPCFKVNELFKIP